MLKRLTNAAQNEKHGPPKDGEQFRSVLSFNKAKNKIQWSPRVSIHEGLEKTIEYYKKGCSN